MRLLDYYSSLALASDDPELVHILNTVMTAEIRKKIEEIQEQKQEIYVSAVAARARIQDLLKTGPACEDRAQLLARENEVVVALKSGATTLYAPARTIAALPAAAAP